MAPMNPMRRLALRTLSAARCMQELSAESEYLGKIGDAMAYETWAEQMRETASEIMNKLDAEENNTREGNDM